MKPLIVISFMLMFVCQALAQGVKNKLLITRNTATKVLADGHEIRAFGFAESLGQQPPIPGPTLIFNEGDSVDIELFNVSQGAAHTVHLHGLDVDQANDGVPHLSFEVGHMQRGNYKFVAPHAGTYLYHCHVVSPIHVQAGMYGLLVVKAKGGVQTAWTGGPSFYEEYSFLTSEIDTNWHTDSVLLHDHNDSMSLKIPIPKYRPQFFLVNGLSDGQIAKFNLEGMRGGTTGLVRLANIGFNQVVVTLPAYLKSEIIASDGRPLPTIERSTTVILFPGERYDVLIKPSDSDYDTILFQYFDMNTGKQLGQQKLPYNIGPSGSVHDTRKNELVVVYPNPTAGEVHLTIDSKVGKVESITCFDVLGRVVLRKEGSTDLSRNDITLDLKGHEGLNHIHILYADGSVSVYKVFVR